MKKPIPKCEHGNEYECDNPYIITLYNAQNRIRLSKIDFLELVKIWGAEETKIELDTLGQKRLFEKWVERTKHELESKSR